MMEKKPLRVIAGPFVVPGPAGVAIRDRLRVSVEDAHVLFLVGVHLGSLASGDLAARSRDGLRHDKDSWAARKRDLTPASSSRWAGSITKASHDQWALARRGLAAHMRGLEAGIATVRRRLALPLGQKGSVGEPGGYRSAREWHTKSRRLVTLQQRHETAIADWHAGRVRTVRGGRRLANTRHHLDQAGLSEQQWREQWTAARLFLSADGETGKRFGNETIRVTPVGQVSLKLPAPLAHLANAAHGRYVLSCSVVFAHRGGQWRDRIEANTAIAYTIRHDANRNRWYLTAAWQCSPAPVVPLQAALTGGCVGVDTNNDHLAAWRLDPHGNPVGEPRRFRYDLAGTAGHRDAQIRHALTRLLHWTRQAGVTAIAVEDLDFTDGKTREKYGRRKRFRNVISRFPTARLRARIVSMAAEIGITVVAVDPAYTSRWGAEHWRKPMTARHRATTRHAAASIVIARRAQGHPARRRTSPPPHHRSDGVGHRSVQAGQDNLGREEPRRPGTGPRLQAVSPTTGRKRATSVSNTVRETRATRDQLPHSVKER
ncbi:IS200/IS605 family accessory protein TnpB-related protein [Actinoplanes palleronii]|uniref:Transposase n=1 Tax=Actinoplanes palleronii TaxID=113570 RepID=A0ABQ4BPC0_9ACTN|nr:IS200/IS605 family accessory protein TnpB-related protein [Actinoplanes palleronii]GIE72131.1 transposase [Actinoplanes palleronii]